MLTRTVIYCPSSHAHWYDGIDPALCDDAAHTHQRFETHIHRTAVTLPDRSTIVAVSFDPAAPYDRDVIPDYGVYLDPVWQPPWPHEHIDWPDFSLPADPAAFAAALTSVAARLRRGDRVELGCLGGHGRTGTALACLAIVAGAPPETAVDWVRAHFCDKAVETDDQQAFVTTFHLP